MAKREKVMFLDIDEVFTTSGKAEERKVVDEAVAALKNAVVAKGYTRLAFVTARSDPWVILNFVPFLKKYDLSGMSEIHCENGLYEIVGDKIIYARESQKFLPFREKIANAIEAKIKELNIRAVNATAKAGKRIQVRFEPLDESAKTELPKLCEAVVEGMKRAGKIPKDIKALGTKSGVNIFPYTVNKGKTARDIKLKWRGIGKGKIRFSGFGIGDQAEDMLMASTRIKGLKTKYQRIKGVKVNNVDEFIKFMSRLSSKRIRIGR